MLDFARRALAHSGRYLDTILHPEAPGIAVVASHAGKTVVGQFELRFLYGPRLPDFDSGSNSAISSKLHT